MEGYNNHPVHVCLCVRMSLCVCCHLISEIISYCYPDKLPMDSTRCVYAKGQSYKDFDVKTYH